MVVYSDFIQQPQMINMQFEVRGCVEPLQMINMCFEVEAVWCTLFWIISIYIQFLFSRLTCPFFIYPPIAQYLMMCEHSNQTHSKTRYIFCAGDPRTHPGWATFWAAYIPWCLHSGPHESWMLQRIHSRSWRWIYQHIRGCHMEVQPSALPRPTGKTKTYSGAGMSIPWW